MNKDLESLMNEFAESVRLYVTGRGHEHFDDAIITADVLLANHNVFAQVRGLAHGINETAVFYAGKEAWEKNMPPFYEIACN